ATAPVREAPDTFAEAQQEPKAGATSAQAEKPIAQGGGGPNKLVHVSTGVLEVWIDRTGGDVVRVRLPRFPVSIDRPDEPFLLLDARADHTYIAQSGLGGRDGFDVTGSRPVYDVVPNDVTLPNGGDVHLKTVIDGSIELEKVYRFTGDDYVVDVDYVLNN